nr:MAG TPA: hypothetical protein [Caudoviricetes sp.]
MCLAPPNFRVSYTYDSRDCHRQKCQQLNNRFLPI